MFTFLVSLLTWTLLIGDGDRRLSLLDASDLEERDEDDEDLVESDELDIEDEEVDELEVDEVEGDDDRDLLEERSRFLRLKLRAIIINQIYELISYYTFISDDSRVVELI